MDKLDPARALLLAASTRSELLKGLRSVLAPYGITAFAIGFIPGPAPVPTAECDKREPFLLLDWPREWLELYAGRGFAAEDVVVAQAARTTEPFTWREVQARHPGASAQIFAAARDFGWTDGFVVPVHDPLARMNERIGIVSMAASGSDGLGGKARPALVGLALMAFARARALHGMSAASEPAKLTRRERETLALVADGWSDAEIGRRLGISTATAHFHIEGGKRRLGASTRAQAVAIAIVRDLL